MEIKPNKYGKYPCFCCGFYTLPEKPPNTFFICPVCFWEDDGVQSDDPAYDGGANAISLNDARKNFKRINAMDEGLENHIRQPTKEELPD